MRTEKCKLCTNYTHVEDQSGREWMNATGWCSAVTLGPKRRRTHEESWCDMFCERFIPEPDTAMVESMEMLYEEPVVPAESSEDVREDAREEALKEAIQLVGDQAVEILLRHKPDASSLLKQATRQSITAPLRLLLKESKE